MSEEKIRKPLQCVQPKWFTVKISNCGTDSCNVSLDRMKNKDANELLFTAMCNISSQFVGEYGQQLLAQVCVNFIKQCKPDGREWGEWIETISKYEHWVLK